MIKIGDVRIRVSNIKNYGIRKEEVFFEKVYGRNRKEKVVEKSDSLRRALGEGLFKTIEFVAEFGSESKGKEKHDYHDYDYEYFHTEELMSVSDERASAVRDKVARSIYVYLKKGESYVLPGSGPPLNERGEESSSLAYHAIQDGSYSGKKIMYADEDGVYKVYEHKVSKKEDITTGIEKYLYVTTFQGDNYVFGKDKIDVDEKVEELDKRFS